MHLAIASALHGKYGSFCNNQGTIEWFGLEGALKIIQSNADASWKSGKLHWWKIFHFSSAVSCMKWKYYMQDIAV